jgi:hypothetical protein
MTFIVFKALTYFPTHFVISGLNSKGPSYVLRMIDTFSKTSQDGFSNWIEEKEFRLRATILDGLKQRTIAS